MERLSWLDWTALILVIIGGLNWGLVGLFKYNLIDSIFGGSANIIARIIYILVALSAIYLIFILPSLTKRISE